MKLRTFLAAGAASLMLAGVVVAQPYGYGMGPGMMGGGGYGVGPGMMGGYGGGHGGGWGGGWGMGPGGMGGWGAEAYSALNLSAEQRKQIADIQEATRKAMWQMMGTMHEQGYHMYGMFGPGPLDDQAAQKAYEQMAATQKAMFALQLDARRKIDAVLTPEQREELRKSWGRR
jgi:Spy/CpxP family protein refolding chaperone